MLIGEAALCGCAAQPGLSREPDGNLSAWSNPQTPHALRTTEQNPSAVREGESNRPQAPPSLLGKGVGGLGSVRMLQTSHNPHLR